MFSQFFTIYDKSVVETFRSNFLPDSLTIHMILSSNIMVHLWPLKLGTSFPLLIPRMYRRSNCSRSLKMYFSCCLRTHVTTESKGSNHLHCRLQQCIKHWVYYLAAVDGAGKRCCILARESPLLWTGFTTAQFHFS